MAGRWDGVGVGVDGRLWMVDCGLWIVDGCRWRACNKDAASERRRQWEWAMAMSDGRVTEGRPEERRPGAGPGVQVQAGAARQGGQPVS